MAESSFFGTDFGTVLPFISQENKQNIAINIEDYEELKALYLNDTYIVESPYTVRRVNANGNRYYAYQKDDGEVVYGAGVTSIISNQSPMSEYLLQWIADQGGYKKYKDNLNKKALYGTFLHIAFADIILKKSISLSEIGIKARVMEFLIEQDYSPYYIDYKEWMPKFQKDIVAFLGWMKDYEIEPVAIEVPLVYQTKNKTYAGCIDFVAKIKVDGKKKKETVLIDFKSGDNGFYEEHEIQIHAYKKLWNHNFPKMKVKRVFNLGMNSGFKMTSLKKYLNGEKSGTFKPYKFQEQTKSKKAWKWEHYLKGFLKEPENMIIKDKIEYKQIDVNLETDLSNLLNSYNPLNDLFGEISATMELF